jgi:hypothetical protein
MGMCQNHGVALFAHQRICGCLILPQQPYGPMGSVNLHGTVSKFETPIPSRMVPSCLSHQMLKKSGSHSLLRLAGYLIGSHNLQHLDI